MEQFSATPPDVVLLDVQWLKADRLLVARQLREHWPEAPIVAITEPGWDVFEFLAAGAHGCVCRHASLHQLLAAIRKVKEGGIAFSPEISREAVQFFAESALDSPSALLSVREMEIFKLLREGYLYKEIALLADVSLDTVRKHLCSIYRKLGVHSRAQAVLKCFPGGKPAK